MQGAARELLEKGSQLEPTDSLVGVRSGGRLSDQPIYLAAALFQREHALPGARHSVRSTTA